MFDAREANTKFSKKINDEWTTWTGTNDVFYESKHISNRVWLLQNEILLLDKQQFIKNAEIKMNKEIYKKLREYEQQILENVLQFLRNSVESQETQKKLLTETCTQLLLKKDADIRVAWCSGHTEIKDIEVQYANKHYISRHKKQIFEFDKKQMKKLYKEYVTKHPDRNPKTLKDYSEFSFLQVQIPILEAFFEYKWKTKRAYEIDLEVPCTKSLIIHEVMELSKFFFDLNYINKEICLLFYRSIRDIGALESDVFESSDSVELEEARNLANEMKDKLLEAKQLAGHEPRQDCEMCAVCRDAWISMHSKMEILESRVQTLEKTLGSNSVLRTENQQARNFYDVM